MGGHRSGKQLFLSWIYSSFTSARTQPVNITVGMLTWKLVSSLFILYLINIYEEAAWRVLCLLQTCSSICLVNLSTEIDCQDFKLSRSKTKLICPPKPVLPPVFLISLNDITILPNVQAPTFGVILAFSSFTTPHISHQLSNSIIFPIHPLLFI